MKIPTEDFTYVTLTIGDTMEMMFEVAMGVMDMEDDKVADMAMKIPNEDFTDGTKFPTNARGMGKFITNTSGATW